MRPAFVGANAIINCDSCGKTTYDSTRGERGELRQEQLSGKRYQKPLAKLDSTFTYSLSSPGSFPVLLPTPLNGIGEANLPFKFITSIDGQTSLELRTL